MEKAKSELGEAKVQPGQDAGPRGEGQEARRHFLNLVSGSRLISGAPGGSPGVGGNGGQGGEGEGNPIPI
jgi:hypothetical protein